ncbi:DsrE family protein [Ottowia testudinis]|uniref:DsrE family protein n=1 Tax=Ottowia testudinis TaxID=2816950 RepID=A0A975CLI3_9BURK|nr:DsrE family protein [Ottowia testudinis]QTD46394.1 DsrE family protein [Ottowia testudinis]
MSFTPDALDGVAILLWAAGPSMPERLATPFFHAAAAAAMEAQVEVYFTAASVRLLVPGVAANLRASPHADQTILAHIQQCVAHGARLLACSDALHAQGIDSTDLIAECHGRGGSVQFMSRVLDKRWATLTY